MSPVSVCIAGALSLAVAMGIGRFAFTPMLPLMLRAGDVDVAQGGWLAAANYVGYLVGALSAPRLRMPPVRLAFAALLLIAVVTAAMGVLHAPWLLGLLRFLAGAGSALAFVGTSVWCLGALAAWGRPTWGGAVYAGVGGGIALAGIYCLLGARGGLSVASLWVQLGVLALVLALLVRSMVRRPDGVAGAPAPAAGATGAPGTRGLVICYGLMGFGYILPATFLPVQARAVVDDPALFGLAWPVFGAMAALSTLAAGWVLRRASRLNVWALSHLAMGLGVLLPSLWLSGWSIACAAVLVGGTFMVATMAGMQEARARATGDPTRLLSRMTAAFAIGQIAGPVVSSALAYLPLTGGNALNLALQIAAVALLLSAAWLRRFSSRTTPAKGP